MRIFLLKMEYLQLLAVFEQISGDMMSEDWYKIDICPRGHRPLMGQISILYQSKDIISPDICSKTANDVFIIHHPIILKRNLILLDLNMLWWPCLFIFSANIKCPIEITLSDICSF